MTMCNNCGRVNPYGSAFCDRCGKSLQREPEPIQSRECPDCHAQNPVSANICKDCAAVLPSIYPGISSTLASTGYPAHEDAWIRDAGSRNSQKPSIAAVLMVGAGALELLDAAHGYTYKVPATDLPIDLSGLVLFCATFVLIMGIIVLAGAYVAFKRGPFTVVLIAAIAGMLGVGLFDLGFVMSLIALVLVALSKDEFKE